MKRWAVVWLSLTGLTMSCEVSENEATRVLEAQGFDDIHLEGAEVVFSRCSDSDSFSRGFRAKNSRGVEVRGVVCCGWLKACTVRF